jgi:hypothetical protein
MVVCKTFWFIIIANCRVEFGRMIPAISGVLEPEHGKKSFRFVFPNYLPPAADLKKIFNPHIIKNPSENDDQRLHYKKFDKFYIFANKFKTN